MGSEGKNVWFHILNIILIVAALFALVVVLLFNSDLKSAGFRENESSLVPANDGWSMLNDDGTLTEFNDFGRNLGVESLVLSRIFVFDQNEFIRDTLSFFSSYCAVEVYQDGALIYSYSSEENVRNRILPGLFSVNAVLDVLPGEASEVTVRLWSYLGVTVNPFYFGSGYDVARRDYNDSLPGVVFAVLSFVLVLLIVLFAILGRKKYTIPASYNYFMGFMSIATVWVISNIKVLAHLGINPGLLCVVANEAFLLFPTFYMIYIYHYFTQNKRLNILLIGLSFLNMVIVNSLVLAKVVSLVESYISTAVICGICLVTTLVQAVREYRFGKTTARTHAMFFGSLILMTGGVFQTYDAYRGRVTNISVLMLLSLVLFALIQSVSFIFYLMNLVAEGRKAGDYLAMAKTDTLTGLGNRRGLEAYISELASRSSSPFYRVGCIVCDLNGLKKTNDTYGHDVGDQMLRDFSSCLKECFENRGVPFRSGGDEFYVLFSDVEVDMGAMMRRLMIGIDGSNTGTEYKLSCSSGCYADYVPSHNEKAVWDIIKMADAEMYKQKMKDRERLGSRAVDDPRLD
ncbi:MAG: GGDEF domain-containing protein [Spirochaetales bacterium]|nr:GGDEF domain-containing protein [Spirochaetales bacterium]